MAEENTEVKFLGRTIGRNERGFYWEEDSKHRDVWKNGALRLAMEIPLLWQQQSVARKTRWICKTSMQRRTAEVPPD